MTRRRALLRLGVLAGGGGAAWLATRGRDTAFAGTPVPPRPAPPLDLLDDTGRPFAAASLRGQPALVTFGYTACPDVCPTMLAALVAARDLAVAQGAPARIVFVTLDPAHDDAASLCAYLAAFAAPGDAPLGLTGSPAQTARAARDWGVTWSRARDARFIDHTASATALDPAGQVRLVYGYSQVSDAAAVARDLRQIGHAA